MDLGTFFPNKPAIMSVFCSNSVFIFTDCHVLNLGFFIRKLFSPVFLGASSVKSYLLEVKPFGKYSTPQFVHASGRYSSTLLFCLHVFYDLDTTIESHNTLNCSHCHLHEWCQQHSAYLYATERNVKCSLLQFRLHNSG